MTTFQTLAERYVERQTKLFWKKSTSETNRSFLKSVSTVIGQIELSDITRSTLMDLQMSLTKSMNSARNNKIIGFVSIILSEAVADGIINKSPAESIKLLKEVKEEITPFTPAELTRVFSVCDPYWVNYFRLMISTGMRPNELTAIRWSDIDLSAGILNISHGRYRNSEGTPKTNNSIRKIELLNPAIEALKDQQGITGSGEFVFISKSGDSIDYAHPERIWARALKLAGVEHRKMYSLRHTFVSKCLQSGIPATWISKQIGHANVKITLSIYSHFVETEGREERVQKFSQMLEAA